MPTISADPEGDIVFDWHNVSITETKTLSISINERGGLSFAAIFGKETHHGTGLLSDVIPLTILDYIHQTNRE